VQQRGDGEQAHSGVAWPISSHTHTKEANRPMSICPGPLQALLFRQEEPSRRGEGAAVLSSPFSAASASL
jgi:hypothetical protein